MRDIRFVSHCEHHIAADDRRQPMSPTCPIGQVWSAFSKLARIVDAFAKRLQSQEILTNQIANTLLKPCWSRAAWRCSVEAEHQCITTRGIHKGPASPASPAP